MDSEELKYMVKLPRLNRDQTEFQPAHLNAPVSVTFRLI